MPYFLATFSKERMLLSVISIFVSSAPSRIISFKVFFPGWKAFFASFFASFLASLFAFAAFRDSFCSASRTLFCSSSFCESFPSACLNSLAVSFTQLMISASVFSSTSS
jgi:hypothetical protein